MNAALAFAHELRQQPNCTIIAPGSRHWDIFCRLCNSADIKGNLLPDAFLAALANEAPRSKLRGTTELKHSELPEIFAGVPLPLHIPLHRLAVRSLPHRRYIVPICPKFPAPQHPLDGRLPSKDFSSRDALEHLYDPSRRHFRMSTAEQMDVILVRPNRLHLNGKPLRNLGRRLPDNCGHFVIQQDLAIFHRKHNVVVDLPRTMRPFPYLFFSLILHAPEGTREADPRSKLRGITS